MISLILRYSKPHSSFRVQETFSFLTTTVKFNYSSQSLLENKVTFLRQRSNRDSRIGPLHDLVTWYKITHADEQVAQWDCGMSRWTGTSCFVLKVLLCNLHTSMCDFVPCRRIGQRAYNGPFRRHGGHFELYCFKLLLWNSQGANTYSFAMIAISTSRIQMAALSPKRSIPLESLI